ncbi:hypothetical protein D9M72_609080 [compost metagenome]
MLELAAQFAARQAPLQFAGGGQFQEHLRVAHGLFGDEVATGGHAQEVCTPPVDPGFELSPGFGGKIGYSGLEVLLRALGEGLEGGRQRGQRRQAHGLS